eukprot:5305601-Alexandrium_andersonii.AAC.1
MCIRDRYLSFGGCSGGIPTAMTHTVLCHVVASACWAESGRNFVHRTSPALWALFKGLSASMSRRPDATRT